MRTYQNTAVAVLDRYDTFYGGHTSDAGVGSERRRRFFDWHGFRSSRTLWEVFVTELREPVVFSVVQTVVEFEGIGWV